MSQTDVDTTGASNDNNQSATDGLTEQVAGLCERLESLESGDVEDMSDLNLVELRAELKDLEGEVEDTRKGVTDEEIESRIEVGENLYGLALIESHRKFLKEEAGSVIARAVSQGIDYTSFVDVNASTLANEHPDLAEVGQSEYTYLR